MCSPKEIAIFKINIFFHFRIKKIEFFSSYFSGNAENGINHKIQPLTNGNHAEIEPEEPQETRNGGTDLFKVLKFSKSKEFFILTEKSSILHFF